MFTRTLLLLLVAMLSVTTAHAETTNITKQAHVQWVNKNSDKTVTLEMAKAIVTAVHKYAEQANIDPALILSIIKAESTFKAKASNKYGAKGLMQVVPRWHKDKIAGRNIFNISTNIEVGVRIFDDCLKSRANNLNKAISCYSGGAGKTYIKNIKETHAALKRADIKLRFQSELPLKPQNALGVARIETPSTYLVSANTFSSFQKEQ